MGKNGDSLHIYHISSHIFPMLKKIYIGIILMTAYLISKECV